MKLRWLPQARSLESTGEDALHEIDPEQPLGEGKPQLRAGQWNQVTLTAAESAVVVKVNGEPVCRFATARDRRFGLLGERRIALAGSAASRSAAPGRRSCPRT